MKNINKNSTKYLLLLIAIYCIMGLILYPIFDIIYCKLITHTEFIYSISNDVTRPITMGIIMAITSWLLEKKSNQ